MLAHEEGSIVAEVVLVRLPVAHVSLAHDENIVASTERVWVHRNGAEIDIRVVTGCLFGG